MTYTYNIAPTEVFNAEARDYRPAFEVHYVTFDALDHTHTEVLATYTTRAAAELVISALRAAQNDLT